MSAQAVIRDQHSTAGNPPGSIRELGAPSLPPGLADWVPDLEFGSSLCDDDTQACRLTVDLIRVIYLGEDIGSDWRYWVFVEGVLWDSGERRLPWHEIDTLNVPIYERIVGPCESSRPIYIQIRARERDRFLFLDLDDIGVEFRAPTLRCIELRDVQALSVPVPVRERRLFPWVTRRVAVLRFDFLLTTECIERPGSHFGKGD